MKNGDRIKVELYGTSHMGELVQLDKEFATVAIGGKQYRISVKQISPPAKKQALSLNDDDE